MLPVEVYCTNCGGFVEMTMSFDGSSEPYGEHRDKADCIRKLREDMNEMKREIEELKGKDGRRG